MELLFILSFFFSLVQRLYRFCVRIIPVCGWPKNVSIFVNPMLVCGRPPSFNYSMVRILDKNRYIFFVGARYF